MEKVIIPREVHDGEGVCRRIILASAISEDCFEAGACAHLRKNELAMSVKGVYINFRCGEAIFESDCRNNVLIVVEAFRAFYRKFEKVRVFVWLEFILYMSRAAMIKNEAFLKLNITVEEARFSGCYVQRVYNCYLEIECKKGVEFGSYTPIINKYLISLVQYYKQPTRSSAKFFFFNTPVVKSNPSFTI
jgi:hypothetical protein